MYFDFGMRIRHIERVRARRRSVLAIIGRNRLFPHLHIEKVDILGEVCFI